MGTTYHAYKESPNEVVHLEIVHSMNLTQFLACISVQLEQFKNRWLSHMFCVMKRVS